MNDRLKELAEQAGFYGEPKFENLERFAELVAKDTESAIFNEGYISGRTDGYLEAIRILRSI